MGYKYNCFSIRNGFGNEWRVRERVNEKKEKRAKSARCNPYKKKVKG